jgi:hypothetical protein
MVDSEATLGGMEIEHPSTILTSPTGQAVIPRLLRRYRPKVTRASALRRIKRLPDVTVVRSESIDVLLSHEAFLRDLSERFERTPEPSKVVFLFESKAVAPSAQEGAKQLVRLFEYFSRPFDLEVATGVDAAEDAFREALAKIVATRNRAGQASAHQDALAKVKRVIAATSDLHASSGKLSATKVAEAFGLSVADLAALIGRSRQAVSKTPDSDFVQPLLGPFERVARLRARLSTEDFRTWLHLTNEQLGKRTPLDLIRDGRVAVVADLAEDMLTGSPA